NFSKNDIINLLSKYIITKYRNPNNLISELNELMKFNIQTILQNMDESALNITTIKDFTNHFIANDKYSDAEKKIITSLINGINISSEIIKTEKQKLEKDDSSEKDNKRLFYIYLFIGIFLSIIFILIYLRRKKNTKK
ncbi:MAG: hypothetical protein U9R54_08470, partial [Bacteroidota bacterium]|nr:hypothetical protein [Bacteroidota bacterium]